MPTPVLSQQAARLNIVFEQGARFDPIVTYKDSNGAANDLTGYTARMQVRDTAASTTVLLDLTTENGGIVLGGVAGTIQIVVTDAQTTAFTFTKGVYDFELINPSNQAKRLFQGTVKVKPEVTK